MAFRLVCTILSIESTTDVIHHSYFSLEEILFLVVRLNAYLI